VLLNSGTTSLLGYTRLLLGDPATAPVPLFADATIYSHLNVWYQTMREKARFVGDGSALKIAYDTGVDGTIEYSKPADFVRLREVHVDLDGGDLSALAPNAARIRILDKVDYTEAYNAYQAEELVDIQAVSIRDATIAILAPIGATAAGSNSIRFVYEASTADLSGDTDEPDFARPHHHTICRLAAMDMMVTKNLENSTQANLALRALDEFERYVSDELWQPNSVAWVAGLSDQDTYAQRSGTIDW